MTEIATITPQEDSLLPGVNVLIEGPTGTGKTHSIGSLVDAGVEVFYLSTEAGLETLLGYWRDRGQEVPPNLHWHYLTQADSGWEGMLASAKVINSMTNEALTKITDPNKHKHNQFIRLLEVLNNFQDQRTGKLFGPVNDWGPDRALAIDALTGVNNAALSLVVGGKPIKSLVDWGIAMDQIEKLVRMLTDGCRCHFIMLAHVEREVDQVLGGVKITVGTLGNKLSAKIPPMFSDVILSRREGTNFFWSTANPQADLKARNLPIADSITPSFVPILEKWKARGGKFTSKVQS